MDIETGCGVTLSVLVLQLLLNRRFRDGRVLVAMELATGCCWVASKVQLLVLLFLVCVTAGLCTGRVGVTGADKVSTSDPRELLVFALLFLLAAAFFAFLVFGLLSLFPPSTLSVSSVSFSETLSLEGSLVSFLVSCSDLLGFSSFFSSIVFSVEVLTPSVPESCL